MFVERDVRDFNEKSIMKLQKKQSILQDQRRHEEERNVWSTERLIFWGGTFSEHPGNVFTLFHKVNTVQESLLEW